MKFNNFVSSCFIAFVDCLYILVQMIVCGVSSSVHNIKSSNRKIVLLRDEDKFVDVIKWAEHNAVQAQTL